MESLPSSGAPCLSAVVVNAHFLVSWIQNYIVEQQTIARGQERGLNSSNRQRGREQINTPALSDSLLDLIGSDE